jgi:hypothetical protein
VTTTVRSVRVELEMGIASYVANARIAGHETDKAFGGAEARISATSQAVSRLERNTGNLAKTSTEARVQQSSLGRDIERTGTSAGRAERSIDKYSGRLRVLTDLALVGGPALLRLGAGSLPAVTAGLVGIGAAGGGIAVTALAVSGLKDALKALDQYQLEPTTENLQKLRIEQEKLGPAGTEFLRYLDQVEPKIQQLQQLARAGIFPGFEDSIDEVLTQLPLVRDIVASLSDEVGNLAADAGSAIASDKVTPFLEYIRTTGAPTLDAFARSAGNVALGLSRILVAFDPATQDAIDGMADGTERFAKATEHLDRNEKFQAFLSEVREAGPEVIDFLGSAIGLMIGLAHASAPFGRVALPALTGVANAFAAIAKSPIGPPLYTAAAGLVLLNRAASIGSKAYGFLGSSLDQLGSKATTTKQKLSLLSARGGVVLAGAAAVGALADSINRINPEDLDRSLTALQFGDVTDTIDKVVSSLDNLESKWNTIDFGEVVTAGGLFGDTSLDKFANNVDEVDQKLAQLVESGNVDEAATLFHRISDLAQAKGVDPSDTAKRFDAYAQALDNVAAESDSATHSSSRFRSVIGGVDGDLHSATMSAEEFSGALAELNGWFDKRQALRDYKDALHDLTKGLKDGFGRKDVENLDTAGRSLLQVAQDIKNPGLRTDFLAGARASLADMADHAGPKAEAAIQRVINKLDSEGLTHPKLIPLSVDDKASPTLKELGIHLRRTGDTTVTPTISADNSKFKHTVDGTKGMLDDLDGSTAHPHINVDPGNSFALLGGIRSELARIVSKTVTVTVQKVGSALPHFADGGTVPGPRMPYRDKVLIAAAPGEEVIANSHGQADRFRADRASGRIPAYANGGTVEDRIASTYTTRYRGSSDSSSAENKVTDAEKKHAEAAKAAAKALAKLQDRADAVSKAFDRQKSKLEGLISQRDSIASTVSSAALHDPFGNGLSGLDAQVEADTGDIEAMAAALATLVKNGLDPKSALYQQLAAHMDVNTAQQLAQLSSGDLATQATRFQQRQDEASALGLGVANDSGLAEAIGRQTKVTDKLEARLHSLEDAIRDLKQLPDKVGHATWTGARDGSREGSEDGTRAGQDEKRRRTAAAVRTGGGSR